MSQALLRDDAAALHRHAIELHLGNQVQDAIFLYRHAVAADPHSAEAWTNLGLALLSVDQVADALECQREALRLAPDNPDAHNNLGMIHYTQGHIAEAESCFRSALRLRGDHANATLNLGSMRQLANQAEEAEALFRRALALGVDTARGKSNLALALLEQGRAEDAERVCGEAAMAAPGSPQLRANRALALLTMGRLEEGWREYEARWELETGGQQASLIGGPRWTGHEDVAGRTVLLWAEQGFGDVLQFCRYVPLVAHAGARVILAVPQALRRVMATLPGVAVLVSEDDEVMPAFDYHCPLMSLPAAFNTTLHSIPAAPAYLRGDTASWQDLLQSWPGQKIGLVWAGRSRTEQPHAVAIDRRRSMSLRQMLPLLSVPGCSFVSLQLGAAAAQLAGLPALHDVSDRLHDWADTAGLISGLDLVIAVDTAVAHLAGALGRPTWLLNRFDSCWRWFQGREDTPWYPSMRIFRQTQPGDWASVIAQVCDALAQAVEAADI